VIPPQYHTVWEFTQGNLTFARVGGEGFVIDKRGRVVLRHFPADQLYRPMYNLVAIRYEDNYFALFNQQAKRIDHGNITQINKMLEKGLVGVKYGKRYGFMDQSGYLVIPPKFKDVQPFAHGVAVVSEDESEGYYVIDEKGRRISDLNFEQIFDFHHGFGIGALKGKDSETHWGAIDSLGHVVIPFRYGQFFGALGDGYSACPTLGSWESYMTEQHPFEILDRKGRLVCKSNLDFQDNFQEGLILVVEHEKYGFADTLGRIVIPCTWDWACPFQKGLAWVKKNERYGFINHQGEAVIPVKYGNWGYDYVYMADFGAPVTDLKTGERFFIDWKGREYRNFPRQSP
jgi:hypothetical protein